MQTNRTFLLLICSLDADATSITIRVEFTKNEFTKIQILDDGCGFKQCDLNSACERFATSKISSYDSLSNLSTFGFRGEALSSISQVCKLEILSKRREEMIGFKQKYADGKPLLPSPQATACNDGSVITINDLFYNNDQRRRVLSATASEFRRMVELVALYSLNNLNVAFHMSKNGGKDVEIITKAGEPIRNRISGVLSHKTSTELIDFSSKDEKLRYSATGVIGNLNSCLPNFRFVFFVNRRLVNFPSLHKSLETLYKDRLAKGSCSFVYLNLDVEPSFVDANIHPSKDEVRLINELDVVDQLTQEIEKVLVDQKEREMTVSSPIKKSFLSVSSRSSPAPSSMRQTTLDVTFGTKSKSDASPQLRPDRTVRHDTSSQRIDEMFRKQKSSNNHSTSERHRPRGQRPSEKDRVEEFYLTEDGIRIANLDSVRDLRSKIQDESSGSLKNILARSTYVGSMTTKIPTLFIQHDVSLIQLHLPAISNAMFYQIFVFNFGNFSKLIFDEKVSIREFAQIHMSYLKEERTLDRQLLKLISRSEMVNDYFSLGIVAPGILESVPELLEDYIPDWSRLPEFCYDLLFNVDWDSEDICFDSFGRSLAKLYTVTEESCTSQIDEDENCDMSNTRCNEIAKLTNVETICLGDDNAESSASQCSTSSQSTLKSTPSSRDSSQSQHSFARTGIIPRVIYPALKSRFLPPKRCEKYFLIRTTVPKLYKVFHRC